jgi:2-succinyl-5-enolpyruvyl-6-hydroxy-3-cyclohexene-1-carboxylate synthase
VIALARDPRIRSHSHIDERCAGFFALGAAKASGRPVAITCTSGTALAELAPAVIEAHEARVPMIVLSADRPSELRESGAGQTIDQLKLFGGAAKWFFEVELGAPQMHGADAPQDLGRDAPQSPGADAPQSPGAFAAQLRFIRTLACRAYWRTLEGRPGPVHLNFPLREPLVHAQPLPSDTSARADGAPYVSRPPAPSADPALVDRLAQAVAGAERVVLVAGRHERLAEGAPATAHDSLGAAAARLCEGMGWPLLADPLSGARRGSAAIANYDALLRAWRPPRGPREVSPQDAPAGAPAPPDLVLRVGDLPTSKPLRRWLAGLTDVPQVALDPEAAWQDPDHVVSASFALEPASALSALAERLHPSRAPAGEDWLGGWRSADERAAEALTGELAGDGLSEPAVARELGILLPESATLFVASSMPVRDIECFWPIRPDPPRVLCNRGANGIDGTVSAAFGATAAVSAGGGRGAVVLMIGDVALAHDIGGLIASRRLQLALTVVLLNNGGGGIFDFLPVARAGVARDIYSDHIATPPGIDFASAAELYGLEHEAPASLPELRAALERALASGRSGIIEVRSDRAANLALHERAWSAVREALER